MPQVPEFYALDVGKSTVKVAKVTWNGKKPTLERAFSFDSAGLSVTSDDANQRTDLATRIKDTLAASKLGTTKGVFALPEPVVFNRLLTLPKLPEEEMNQAIHWNAKQFIPIPVEDVQMDWIPTAEMDINGKKMVQLLLVAAPKKLITNAMSLFEEANQELIAIETEAVATARLIALNYPESPPQLVADIGNSGTDLSVVVSENLIFSQSIGTGVEAMNNAIAKAFSLDAIQADQYRSKFGLDAAQAEGKIAQTLTPIIQVIAGEVGKTLNFFKSKYQQNTPQKILLVGEGASTPGLTEYFTQNLQVPTEAANLSANLKISTTAQSEMGSDDIAKYAVAIGLALKTE